MSLMSDGTYQYSATVLVRGRGATWDEHRRQVERHCSLVSQSGHSVRQFSGDVSGLEAFLQDRRVRNPSGEDLLAYPDMHKQCCRRHSLGSLD